MECLPSLHLPINGSGRGVAGSSIQQPQHFTCQISSEVPS